MLAKLVAQQLTHDCHNYGAADLPSRHFAVKVQAQRNLPILTGRVSCNAHRNVSAQAFLLRKFKLLCYSTDIISCDQKKMTIQKQQKCIA
jgi:hypothetical protein